MKTYGVFEHSSGPEGGYVVRMMIDGTAASPYLNVKPYCILKTERGAQVWADKLNEPRFGTRNG